MYAAGLLDSTWQKPDLTKIRREAKRSNLFMQSKLRRTDTECPKRTEPSSSCFCFSPVVSSILVCCTPIPSTMLPEQWLLMDLGPKCFLIQKCGSLFTNLAQWFFPSIYTRPSAIWFCWSSHYEVEYISLCLKSGLALWFTLAKIQKSSCLMSNCWHQEGFSFHFCPYRVLPLPWRETRDGLTWRERARQWPTPSP